MKRLALLLLITLTSCASSKLIKVEDITDRTEWLESTPDNPIINVIQKQYANEDIEIIIKKKLTTDSVKIRLTKGRRVISKTTTRNEKEI